MPKSVIRTAKKSKDRGQKGGPGAMAKSVFNTTSSDGKIKKEFIFNCHYQMALFGEIFSKPFNFIE